MSLTLRAGLLAGLALALPIVASAEPVSLDDAVSRAIAAWPAIQAQEAGVRSARAGRSQADVRPNPILSVEPENIAGTSAYDVYRQAETTVALLTLPALYWLVHREGDEHYSGAKG